MRRLLDQKVTEEILSREAVARGLDRADQIIKRRRAQKMDFLAADVASLEKPSDAVLAVWFQQNAARFSLPPHASFRHLYFSSDKRGGELPGTPLLTALVQIADRSPDVPDAAKVADPFMFQNHCGDATPDQMAKEFGPDFATALFQLQPGSGKVLCSPAMDGISSGSTRLTPNAFRGARAPGQIRVDRERYREVKRTVLDEMRSRYTVLLPAITLADLQDLQRPVTTGAAPECSRKDPGPADLRIAVCCLRWASHLIPFCRVSARDLPGMERLRQSG